MCVLSIKVPIQKSLETYLMSLVSVPPELNNSKILTKCLGLIVKLFYHYDIKLKLNLKIRNIDSVSITEWNSLVIEV